MDKPRVVIVMGVAGSGKSTVAARLAARNGGVFEDADDYHPPENVAKMAAGTPLDDADRFPWLDRLRREVVDATPQGRLCVLACSALKRIYRERLGFGLPDVRLVYLKGRRELLLDRLAARSGHFMKAGMLDSQLAALEEPAAGEGVTVEIAGDVDDVVADIEPAVGLNGVC